MKEKLLVVTSTFPLSKGDGNPRFVYDLATALADHAQVTVLAPGAVGASRCERMASLDVVRFAYFWPSRLQRLAYGAGMPYNLRHSWLALVQVVPFLICEGLAIRRLCRRLAIGKVNAHWIVPQGLAAAMVRGKQFDLFTHVHSSDLHLLRRIPAGRAIARFVVRRSSRVFVTSTFVRDKLDELLGFASGSLIQPMGVDVKSFRDKVMSSPSRENSGGDHGEMAGEEFLLFVGRLVPVKGAEYLIRAFSDLRSRYPGLALYLVGTGPEEESLRSLVSALGLESAVKFLGRLPHAEVAEYYRACKVFVLPSISGPAGATEGMPTVVLEAMAAGARVVATGVGGVPDIVKHGENGWLCSEKDPRDLAEKIQTVLDDADPSQVVRNALHTAGEYDWQLIARRYAGFLETDNAA